MPVLAPAVPVSAGSSLPALPSLLPPVDPELSPHEGSSMNPMPHPLSLVGGPPGSTDTSRSMCAVNVRSIGSLMSIFSATSLVAVSAGGTNGSSNSSPDTGVSSAKLFHVSGPPSLLVCAQYPVIVDPSIALTHPYKFSDSVS